MLACLLLLIVIRFDNPYPTKILKIEPANIAVTAIRPQSYFGII
jgi:hypothetical protein